MAIYRGSGGAGDATGDATNASQLALAAAAEAQASATSAASSATNAANSASAAATDATDAAASETNAAGSAADALASENAAASSASDAADSASAAATSATNAASSASTASTQATNASNSASSASTSATNAANSATSASTSASSASTSATTASTAATNAGNSATAAATSATNAAASASTASTQASNASTSATNAASSATAASTSATNAASSASTASTAATNASNSASAASTSASNAATSETNAASSASSAASSASSAASSAASAAAALDSFDDRYLGSKTSNPTLDNDGNALVTGALYYNSVDGEMRVYDGSQWIAASAASQAILTKYKYVATAGQTTFTGSDANALTLAYTVGSIIVTLNGAVLDAVDYTASSGTSIVLASAASLNDEVGIFAFSTFDVANTYTQAQADAKFVELIGDTMTGDLRLNNGNADGAQLQLASSGYSDWNLDNYSGRLRAYYGSTEYFTINSSGNVGIGTSSPSSKVTAVSPDNNAYTNVVSAFSNNLAQSTSLTYAGLRASSGAGIGFYVNGSTSSSANIDSSGNLLVGTTGANGKFTLVGGTVSASTYTMNVANASYTFMLCRDDGYAALPSTANKTTGSAANLYIDSASGYLFRSTSSLKYKKNVADAVHGLNDLLNLRAVTYEGNSEADNGKTFGGLIAEEVHEAGLTEFVQYAEDGTPDALAYGNMVSLCIKAIQEQQTLIQDQLALINAQQAALTSLTARIEALESK